MKRLRLALLALSLACLPACQTSVPLDQPAPSSAAPVLNPVSNPPAPGGTPGVTSGGSDAAPVSAPATALPKGLASIRLDADLRFLTAKGQSQRLSVIGLDAQGRAVTGPIPLRFELSRPGDFSVTPEGLVTALTDLGYSEVIVRVPGTAFEARLLISVDAFGGGTGIDPRAAVPEADDGEEEPVTRPPLIETMGPSRVEIPGGGTPIRFTAEASDPDGDTLSYAWRCLDTDCADFLTAEGSQVYWRSPLLAGDYRIELSVSDGRYTTREVQVITVEGGSGSITTQVGRRIHYVNDDVSGGSSDGSSWANAFTDLQDALAIAAPGEEIRIAEGSYQPGALRSDSFALPAGVRIYGGFADSEPVSDPADRDWSLHATVLDGNIGAGNSAIDNSFHVVLGGDGASLDGLTIANGNASGSGSNSFGGGLFSDGAGLTLRHVVFRANRAGETGGGLFSNSELSLNQVVFEGNSANSGGGMASFDENPRLEQVIFSGNSASTRGGGLSAANLSVPELVHVTFVGNSAPAGAGIATGAGSPLLVNVLLVDDSLQGLTLPADQGNVATSDDPFVDATDPDGDDDRWFSEDDGLRLHSDATDVLDQGVDGFTGLNLPRIDVLGVPRAQGAQFDPGAYEGAYTPDP